MDLPFPYVGQPLFPPLESSKPECDALRVSGVTGGTADHSRVLPLIHSGFALEREWTASVTPGDSDTASWWSRGNACIIAFKCVNHESDMRNLAEKFSPTTRWGISGLPEGLADELAPLVDQMDFAAIRAKCTGSLTATGFSMGGMLAQLFSVLINKATDPLAANLGVTTTLYTFGAQPLGYSEEANDGASDGCFDGEQFYSAMYEEGPTGRLLLDQAKVYQMYLQTDLLPVKSKKTALVSGTERRTFPCGEQIPENVGGIPALLEWCVAERKVAQVADGTADLWYQCMDPAFCQIHDLDSYASLLRCW